ncbi:MAG TPA: hypothetical protein VFZ34_22955 [Blastocatellia bacterium]|nr:hypothetical protein [Blastocatellia bacterium]
MSYHLTFEIIHEYDSSKGGIWLPAFLTIGGTPIDCEAKDDTGSEYCLFQRELGEDLGLEIERGQLITLKLPNGITRAYGHEVELSTIGLAFFVTGYFAEDYGLPRNLLGRNGWLQQVKLAVVDYEETLSLSAYEPLIN